MLSISSIVPKVEYSGNNEHERVCSCCLSEDNLTNMEKHFTNDKGKFETYLHIISSCYDSTILDRTEMLSDHYICELCIQRLLDSYHFKCQVVEAQKTLLGFIKIRESKMKHQAIAVSREQVLKKQPTDKLNIDPEEESKTDNDSVTSGIDYESHADSTEQEKLSEKIAGEKLPFFLEGDENTKEQEGQQDVKECQIKILTLHDPLASVPKNKKLQTLKQQSTSERLKFLCIKCGRHFTTYNRFMNHSSTHNMSFQCKDCKKVFEKKNQLKNHILYHHKDLRHACMFCDEKFKHYESKRAHIRNVHLEEAVRMKNPSNHGSEYRTAKEKLRVHVCTVCGKGFYTGYTLNSHMVVHFGEKIHTCDECGKSFARKFTLNLHKKKHMTKEHLCDHCGQAFVQKCSLKAHIANKRCKNTVRTVLVDNFVNSRRYYEPKKKQKERGSETGQKRK